MRDQMDATLWNEHHDRFSEWLDRSLAAAGGRLRRSTPTAGALPGQLLAAVAAIGLTLATVGASTV